MKDKTRLLHILDFLYKNTNVEDYETTVSIINYLYDKGISVDRKTLQQDIQCLIDMGFGITKEKSSPNKYRWEKKLFKPAELQMLTDAVLSSRFISKTKSKELIERIARLTSQQDAKQLKQNIACINRPKANNLQSYHTINIVTDAIQNHKCIAFKYTEYNQAKEKVYRKDGKIYTLSPYKLYWNEDYYYLIGWSEKHNDAVVYRVDHMEGVRETNSKYFNQPSDFDLDDYADQFFQMYDGEEVVVELEVQNHLMRYIVDKFGIDVRTTILSDNTFKVSTSVRLSPTFYGWVFQFAGQIKILGPEKAIQEYASMKEQ